MDGPYEQLEKFVVVLVNQLHCFQSSVIGVSKLSGFTVITVKLMEASSFSALLPISSPEHATSPTHY